MVPDMSTQPLAAHRHEVMRYWERNRLTYLACLTIATVLGYLPGWEISSGIGDRPCFGTVGLVLAFGAGFVVANCCYSVVYVPEFILMGTRLYKWWRKLRLGLVIAGCILGMALAFDFSREVFRAQYSTGNCW